MIRQNLHTHSEWDDGANTLEEMAQAAISAGLTSLGFSVHSYMPFPSFWTIEEARIPDYTRAVHRLRDEFAGTLAIYHGAEWDTLSKMPLDGYDYVIGSIHHIQARGQGSCVDNTPEMTKQYIAELFDGSADAAAEAYFAQYESLAKVEKVGIVGHFDLLTKFDETDHFFDADSPRFRAAAIRAMDALVAANKVFEINTGAISRGYRTMPYPSRALLKELGRRKARITVSADAHAASDVAFGFAEAEALAIDCGFTEVWQFDGRGFVPTPIGGGG
ncbi:Histidinol-phosphatase [bioreactor metagenome]|uniref:histidinol-phosphatase n=1 Tax=bioreactor metagenome TaxID=1076179 RepID=A0A645C573_9ZZZZ